MDDVYVHSQLTAPLKADLHEEESYNRPMDRPEPSYLAVHWAAALDLSSDCYPLGPQKVGLSAPYASGALIGIWNVKQRNAAQNDDDLMAVDVLTARDIAETMLSDLGVKQRVSFLKDRTCPIVDTVLDSRPENGYEVWRVSSLVDLPDAAPIIVGSSPPTQSSAKSEPTPLGPPPRPSSLEMETVDGGSGKGLIDYISTILLSPSRATRKAF
ncbi:hypothetical protein Pst134EB_010163 [Puccinia striiformis f. sp. tritici]|nr:hypothetical protein Pst134EB_010163 [Puccinia striiformis f. sp. tritici]